MNIRNYVKALPLAAAAALIMSAPASRAELTAGPEGEAVICTTVVNAMNYVFTMVQGKPVEWTCQLKSLNRLDDAALQDYLVKGQERNRKCIAIQNKVFNTASRLGYDFHKPGLRFDGIQEKIKTIAKTPQDMAKFNAETTPSEEFVNSELNSIKEAYDTVVSFSRKGQEIGTRPVKSCTIVTAKNIYACSDVDALCR